MNPSLILLALLVCIAPFHGHAHGQEFFLGSTRTLPDAQPNVPVYRFCPDGHISLVKDGDQWQMYWAGSTTYRTLGPSIDTMKDPVAVLEPGPRGDFDNGGAWLFAVFRQSGEKLLGFYHAEDHEFSGDPSSKFVAWKSIARCTSHDNGKTWRKHGQIITSARPKPATPTWGGCGDCCVVWDDAHNRWTCFYQEHFLHVAISTDSDGQAGTWKKYDHGEFSPPGLGGASTPITSLSKFPGGNPSVVFNKFLNAWLIVWGTWDMSSPHPNSIWISTSRDLLDWTAPRVVVKATGNERNWYPTLFGETEPSGGENLRLCYAHFADKPQSDRQFILREITFQRE
jgi:hypothetical protein